MPALRTAGRTGFVAFVSGLAVLPTPVLADDPPSIRIVLPSGHACPDRVTLEGALAAHGFSAVSGASLYVANVEPIGQDLRLRVQGVDGRLILERIVPSDECQVMAEAIGLLARRAVRGVRWRGRPPPGSSNEAHQVSPAAEVPHAEARLEAPGRRRSWALVPQIGALASSSISYLTAGPRVSLELRTPSPLALSLGVGGWSQTGVPAAGGWLDATGLPMSADAGVAFESGRFRLSAAARFELEVVNVETRGLARTANRTQTASRVGPALGVALKVARRLELRLDVAALVILQGYRFVVGTDTVAEHEAVSVETTASAGYRFSL